MRILKRPSPPSSSTAPANSGSAAGETLKEREARYHAARERIFGASPNGEQANDDKKKVVAAASVRLVREPRGPDGSKLDTKGFGERKATRPATTMSPPASANSS
jgi:SUZ domain